MIFAQKGIFESEGYRGEGCRSILLTKLVELEQELISCDDQEMVNLGAIIGVMGYLAEEYPSCILRLSNDLKRIIRDSQAYEREFIISSEESTKESTVVESIRSD